MSAGAAGMSARATAGLALLIAWTAVVMAQSTVSPGKAVFEKRCGGCHSVDRDKEGPRLGGVVGRRAGSVAGFEYSDALKKSKITWNAETLDKWLTSTDSVAPGNDMTFRVEKAEERRAIIEYLSGLH
jgi:cytochrome c